MAGMTALVRAFALGPGAFRVILALAVVLSHMSALNVGRPAVMLFFMLSGYWVLALYERMRGEPNALLLFWLSRSLRIFLPFLAAWGLATALFAALGLRIPQSQAGMALLGVASHKQDILGVSWSLDIELQFYLLVPLLGWALRRRPIWVCLAVVPLTLLGQALRPQDLVTVLAFALPFASGACLWHWRAEGRVFVTAGRAAGSVMLFLLVGGIVWMVPAAHPLLDKAATGAFATDGVTADLFGMLWSLVLLPYVFFNLQQRSSAFDRHLGNYSYSLYLVHFALLVALRDIPLGPGATFKLLCLAVILVAATGFYLVIDRPCEAIRLQVLAWARRRLTPAGAT